MDVYRPSSPCKIYEALEKTGEYENDFMAMEFIQPEWFWFMVDE